MAKRKKQKKNRKENAGIKYRRKYATKGICRDCGTERTGIKSNEWGRASKPRCFSCGGLLERPTETQIRLNTRPRSR